MQRGRGAGVAGEAVTVTVAVAVEGLRRAGGGARDVLRGEQRAGCPRASLGMLWDPATLRGTWEVSPSGVAPETAPWGEENPEQPGHGSRGSRGCPEPLGVLGCPPYDPQPSHTCAEPAAVEEGGQKVATDAPGGRSQSHQEPVWGHTGRAAWGLGTTLSPALLL